MRNDDISHAAHPHVEHNSALESVLNTHSPKGPKWLLK